MLIKASRIYGIGLTLLAVSAFSACSSDETPAPINTAGTSSAGTLGSAGTPAGTAGTPAGTAGTPAGTGGTPAGTAGTPAGGGTTGAGGAGSNACKGNKPASTLITTFDDTAPNPTMAGDFKFVMGVPGGTYRYPKANLVVDVAGKTMHVTGMVKDYSGFGIYFDDCTNAVMAGATGVSFNIKGNAGTTGMLSLRLQTNSNTPAANGKGLCPAGALYADCHAAMFNVPITAGGADVAVTWDKFTMGLPTATVDGKDVTGVEWAFDWAAGADYAPDVTVDDIKFTGTITSSGGTGTGGSGGSGGAAGGSGGSGGAAGGSGGSGGASGGNGGSGGN